MKNRNYICGMEAWMFWLLLAVVLFAAIGPEVAFVIRKLLAP